MEQTSYRESVSMSYNFEIKGANLQSNYQQLYFLNIFYKNLLSNQTLSTTHINHLQTIIYFPIPIFSHLLLVIYLCRHNINNVGF